MRLTFLCSLLFVASTVAQTCNGNAALCSRKWSNVSQIGAHDSAFVGSLPTDNQDVDVTAQLNAGIRFLQAQTHYFLDTLSLCHTSCFELYAGTLVSYLTKVKTWMDANPDEVVTLLITNGDRVSVSLFGDAMTASKLSTYAYTPSSQLAIDDWPTLQNMISSGDRLVMFLDYLADTTVVPYILDEFSYFFETAFDVTTPDFPTCALDRPPNSNGNGLMAIVNHFLDVDILGILIPDNAADATTNAATGVGSIGAQAALCETTWGRIPRVVLVDFYDKGDVFTAQNNLNGL